MSQQSVLSYFKNVKRSLPDQHAAKKRKVALQMHEIENLLHTESDDDESAEEISENVGDETVDQNDQASDALKESKEFEDDSDWEDLANKTLDDVEQLTNKTDDDEEHSNKTVDEEEQPATNTSDDEEKQEDQETIIGVTTWAGDDHDTKSNDTPEKIEQSSSSPPFHGFPQLKRQEEMCLRTPTSSSVMTEENSRRSKKTSSFSRAIWN